MQINTFLVVLVGNSGCEFLRYFVGMLVSKRMNGERIRGMRVNRSPKPNCLNICAYLVLQNKIEKQLRLFPPNAAKSRHW